MIRKQLMTDLSPIKQKAWQNRLLSSLVNYTVLGILFAGGYALLATGVSLLFVNEIASIQPVIIGIAIFILALAFNPLRSRLQNLTDPIFFPGAKAYEARLHSFTHALTGATDANSIVQTLRRSVDGLEPNIDHVFVHDPDSGHFYAAGDGSGSPTSEIRFPDSSPLPAFLHQRRGSFFIKNADTLPASLEKERPRLALLGAELYIPLHGRQRLAGWLALAPRRSGQAYNAMDLGYLETLADQAAAALERILAVAQMENRVRELTALSRVAQGVNVTISFDDILELIYAQTNQIAPALDFAVTLYDQRNDSFQRPFYLENDQRIESIELSRFQAGANFDQEVIRSRRAILTGDYRAECQKRGLEVDRPYLFAWMGVPLSSGDETIGALSLGSRDSTLVYTQEQLQLVQAIADQTAGAIIKARLLQVTEQRARQLATLNEVTRQLTSTLDTESLLVNILKSAVEILNCEAGSLLVPDETSAELVIKVVAGPLDQSLVNQRLPLDSGIAGQAFQTNQPVIGNHGAQSSAWTASEHQERHYPIQAALAVPLGVKENILGVIEVFNRLDQQPFTPEDIAFLSAFASQASIAIENARLYNLTDQALADRVEELSVMQRIDRQLNTSLNVDQAMKITLDWAMRRSHAHAGLVGVIQENALRIMAVQGYTSELNDLEDQLLPLERLPAQDAITDGTVQRFTLAPGSGKAPILSGARSQVIIPIQRETAVAGILLLESLAAEVVPADSLPFLTRLVDHASIAIANAQLYTAVQEANLAKSEFVSIVAHELKNPMTSIKGYTDLLAAGAVGAVNDNQANFLSTIRANIDRMNTLVSDLNDLSKIEAGRMRLDFKPLPVIQLVEESLRGLRRQIEEKGQTLELQIPANLPNVWADRTRVLQVLVNLISNAHKYTPTDGKITITAELAANEAEPAGLSRVIHMAVCDTGIGMTPEDQKKVFLKFFRSEDPKTREAPGTGLGLNITRSLVEMQGGKIWFESEFRAGSIFHITLPIAE